MLVLSNENSRLDFYKNGYIIITFVSESRCNFNFGKSQVCFKPSVCCIRIRIPPTCKVTERVTPGMGSFTFSFVSDPLLILEALFPLTSCSLPLV